MATIQDYILEYKDEQGNIVCNLFDYYRRYIKPLNKEFGRYDLFENKLVLCWFKDHEDVNPSMGYINDRQHKGGKVYHCFGCGRTGNVIRLHQLIQSQYFDREIDEVTASKELATLFNIPLDDFDETAEDDYETQYLRRIKRARRIKTLYTVNDYANNLLGIRKSHTPKNINLADVNAECIKLIASIKYLYNQ